MQRLLDFFGSVRLTLGVLLFLALGAVAGTLRPVEQTVGEGPPVVRFDLYFQSPWYRLLLLLLAVNLAVCTWRTLRRTLGERRRLTAQVEAGLAAAGPGHDLPAALSARARQRAGARPAHPRRADGLIPRRPDLQAARSVRRRWRDRGAASGCRRGSRGVPGCHC